MISLEELAVEGAPQVGITVSATDAVVSVEMSWDGDRWQAIATSPMSQRVTVQGTAFFRHFTPPLNVEAFYRVVVHSGTVPAPLQASIMVESDSIWIQDPLDPRSAVPVQLTDEDDRMLLAPGAFSSLTRVQIADATSVWGTRLPVASIGQRRAPSGIPLGLQTFAAAQGELVRNLTAMFDAAGSLVLRGVPSQIGLDPVAHVIAPDIQESPYVGTSGSGWRRWDMTVTQVAGPGLRVVIPWWTYEQVTALWREALGDTVTYAQAVAARPGDTYLDWMKEPTP